MTLSIFSIFMSSKRKLMNEIWLVLPAGILISTVVSSIGIGGGILWMPFLLVVLKMNPETAVPTSLLIQTVGKGSGSIAYLKQRKAEIKLAVLLILIAVPGIAAGAYIANKIKPSLIGLVLGLLILTTAFLFVSSHQNYADSGSPQTKIKKVYRRLWVAIPISIGSGMLSTGMGEWLIPVMRGRLSLKMSSAIATCIILTFAVCLIGSSFHFILGGKADWPIVLWAAPGVMIGGQIGPRITQKINERLLKEIFIFLLTLIGIHLIYNSY